MQDVVITQMATMQYFKIFSLAARCLGMDGIATSAERSGDDMPRVDVAFYTTVSIEIVSPFPPWLNHGMAKTRGAVSLRRSVAFVQNTVCYSSRPNRCPWLSSFLTGCVIFRHCH